MVLPCPSQGLKAESCVISDVCDVERHTWYEYHGEVSGEK